MSQSRPASGLVLRRLHSLSGVFPLALFMLVQLAAHAKALEGAEAHRASMEALAALPAAPLWHVLVLASLAFHAGYGIVLAMRPRYNVGRYPLSSNWTYTLLRLSGLFVLGFVLLHMALFWLPQLRGELGPGEMHAALTRRLSSTVASIPLIGLGYLLGLGASVFHLTAGLWNFAARWGLTRSRRGRARLGAALAVLGLGLFAIAANTVLALAAGAPLLGADR